MSPILASLSTWRLGEDAPLCARVVAAMDQTPGPVLARIAALGRRVEEEERQPWERVPRPGSADDRATAQLWAVWAEGRPWEVRDAWERAFLPAATRSFNGVMAARALPVEVRRRVLGDLREAFFYALVADGARDLAARVVETASGGPLTAVLGVLPDDTRLMFARCGAARGGWAESAAGLWPERPDAEARSRALYHHLARAQSMEPLADAHVVLRLAAADDDIDPWQTVVQNRRRLRGRLRAAAASHAPEALYAAVLALPGLTGRTTAAVAAWAWRLAWRELERDFAFGAHAGSPCLRMPGLPAIDPADRDALRTWLLLVVLRGRLPHLQRWVRTGGTGDRDTTWGRLCAHDLPARLRDAEGGYVRVRADLADSLERELGALTPVFDQLAALAPGRRLASEALALLSPSWSRDVPLPKSGFPRMLEAALELRRR